MLTLSIKMLKLRTLMSILSPFSISSLFESRSISTRSSFSQFGVTRSPGPRPVFRVASDTCSHPIGCRAHHKNYVLFVPTNFPKVWKIDHCESSPYRLSRGGRKGASLGERSLRSLPEFRSHNNAALSERQAVMVCAFPNSKQPRQFSLSCCLTVLRGWPSHCASPVEHDRKDCDRSRETFRDFTKTYKVDDSRPHPKMRQLASPPHRRSCDLD